MKALVFGVDSGFTPPAAADGDGNPLLAGLAHVPMALQDVPDPALPAPDWVVLRPRLTGICGSDAKQVFMDMGGDATDFSMTAFISFPQVLGHEVVADVVEVGPAADGVTVGDRVVLQCWLSCAPRGIDPVCPACAAGDYQLCWNFTQGGLAPGIHTGNSSDATGGFAELLPAHRTQVIPVPDALADESGGAGRPVRGLAALDHPSSAAARRPGAGVGRRCARYVGDRHPRARSIPTSRSPRSCCIPRSSAGARARRARRPRRPERRGTRGRARRVVGRPDPHSVGGPARSPTPAGSTSGTTPSVRRRPWRSRSGCWRRAGTLAVSGVHAAGRFEWSPWYFREVSVVGSNAFGVEEVDGVRKHAIEHYLDFALNGRVDISRMLTHTFRLPEWRDAFTTIAEQHDTGAIKVAFDFR